MSRLVAVCVVPWLCVTVGLAAEEPAVAIQGEWRVVFAEVDGLPFPAELFENSPVTFRFDEGKLFIDSNGTKVEGEYTLDATESPMQLSLSPQGEKSHDGIFRFEDETLLFYAPVKPGGPRPTEFKSDKGSNQSMTKLKRVTK